MEVDGRRRVATGLLVAAVRRAFGGNADRFDLPGVAASAGDALYRCTGTVDTQLATIITVAVLEGQQDF